MSDERPPSLEEENDRLRERLAELEETLHAIRTGQVDALVHGNDIFTLESAESASNRFRGQVLEQINETVIAVDDEYRITYINEAAEKQYGRSAAEVLGLRVSALYEYQWVNEGDEQASLAALRDEGYWRGENIHIKHNGEVIHVESVITVLRDTEGKGIGLLAVMRDITQRVKDREALEESARQKDQFLATLAHELRNPLAPLMNGLQLLDAGGQRTEVVDRTRAMMQRQLDHLVRLVDDLMDLSRISRGKLELRREPVQVATIVDVAVEASKPLMDQHGHTFRKRIEEEPLLLYGDATRLSQVISNLLNNAAKYTPAGGEILLEVSREGQDAVVSVTDNGIGIQAENISGIFDMFAQLDEGLQGAGGLGIGLNIAQRITLLHKGSLEVHSEGVGKGSRFTLRLPLMIDPPPAAEHVHTAASLSDTTGLRILVVDDNEDGALTLAMLLRRTGNVVEVAHNGEQALSKGAHFHPDLVFMDIGMPVMDGYQACQHMRAEAWGEKAHIVAVSGWGQEHDRQRSKQSGFDKHLVKPIDQQDIQRVLEDAARHVVS